PNHSYSLSLHDALPIWTASNMAPSSGSRSPGIVVNLHVTERCNYHCSFCFGRWGIGSAERDLFEDVDRAGALIADVHAVVAALRPDRQPVRFNFVGGEPALLRSLPWLVESCRALGARVSFVSNGLMLHRFA